MTTYCMIPARVGSERIQAKNLRLLNGRTLSHWAAEIASQAKCFDGIFINSEDSRLWRVARECNCRFYHRNPDLAGSGASTDDVVFDFVQQNPCEVLFIVNPTAPLLDPEELGDAVSSFCVAVNHNSIHSIGSIKVHSMWMGGPINFNWHEKLKRTQDLNPVEFMAFAFMGWRTEAFMKAYAERGHGFFVDPVMFRRVSKLSQVDIDTEEDFAMAEKLMTGKVSKVEYYQ